MAPKKMPVLATRLPANLVNTFVAGACIAVFTWAYNTLVATFHNQGKTETQLEDSKTFRDRAIAVRDREYDALMDRETKSEDRQYEIIKMLGDLKKDCK